MSTANTLSALTAKLNPHGQQRLFEFLDIVDTDTAARFRDCLGSASDTEVSAVADLLNCAKHGREVAGWWQRRSRTATDVHAQSMRSQGSSSSAVRPDRAAPTKSNRNAGVPIIVAGYVLMVIGNLAAASGDGGVILGAILGLTGLLVHVGGCMKYAEEKGHSKWVGLVGLLTCVGLLILLLLPDRYRGVR